MTRYRDAASAPRYWLRPMSLDDQLVTDEALDAVVGLGARWPEPRALDQTRVFHLDDRGALSLRLLDDDGAADLLRLLELHAEALHEVACCDDEATTSSALEWALDELGVPPVHAFTPRAWLEPTELVRWLRARPGAH